MKGSAKAINGWAMYDWANSAYNLVITATVFPVYYDAVTSTRNAAGTVIGHTVDFLGIKIESGTLYNYSIAFAYLLIALLSPLLSSIADYRGNKKKFLQFFCYLGGLACCGLYGFTSQTLLLGIICCIVAVIGYCGSLVFYNSYLPEIAPAADQDRVSAKGFAMGYIGSVLLQIICFALIKLQPFGMDAGKASRISFLLVGLWWMGFAQITFRSLPLPALQQKTRQSLTKGFEVLYGVLKEIRKLPVLRNFLFAFFFYSMGIQTIMLAAALFGSQELHMEATQLIGCILVIQLVAIAGAFLLAQLSKKWGNIYTLIAGTIIWIAVCIIAYNIKTASGFYVVAVLVGLVMGGVQSLSRSTYSKLMPATTNTASYFSFYDVTEKIAIVIGMFLFGFIEQLTGNMRKSVLALVFFFLVGLVGLLLTRRMEKRRQA